MEYELTMTKQGRRPAILGFGQRALPMALQLIPGRVAHPGPNGPRRRPVQVGRRRHIPQLLVGHEPDSRRQSEECPCGFRAPRKLYVRATKPTTNAFAR